MERYNSDNGGEAECSSQAPTASNRRNGARTRSTPYGPCWHILRRQKSYENLRSLLSQDDNEPYMVEKKETKTFSLNGTIIAENNPSSGESREINTQNATHSVYDDLSEEGKSILRQHVSESSLPQMKTHIAQDIRNRIVLWGMKDQSFNNDLTELASAKGKIIPTQLDKESVSNSVKQLSIRKAGWRKQVSNAVTLRIILEYITEENLEDMDELGIGVGISDCSDIDEIMERLERSASVVSLDAVSVGEVFPVDIDTAASATLHQFLEEELN